MITVIVPVYNMEKYLDRLIPSLLGQTFRDFEIILVDDGSTDGSADICDRAAGNDPVVRTFHKKNGGLSSARNYGLEHARGDFVVFADPDDWVEPSFLETLMGIHLKHHADLEICGHYVFRDDGKGGKETVWNAGAEETVMDTRSALRQLMLWGSFCGYTWNKLFHMDVIRENQLLFDEELGAIQDLHFCYRYISRCGSIAYDPKPVYHYDRGSGVTSPSMTLSERKMSGLSAYRKIAELAKDDYPEIADAAYSSLFDRSMNYIYSYYRTGMNDREKLETLTLNLKTYAKWFFSDRNHSSLHKLFGRLAISSPRIYYYCSYIKRKISGAE